MRRYLLALGLLCAIAVSILWESGNTGLFGANNGAVLAAGPEVQLEEKATEIRGLLSEMKLKDARVEDAFSLLRREVGNGDVFRTWAAYSIYLNFQYERTLAFNDLASSIITADKLSLKILDSGEIDPDIFLAYTSWRKTIVPSLEEKIPPDWDEVMRKARDIISDGLPNGSGSFDNVPPGRKVNFIFKAAPRVKPAPLNFFAASESAVI